MPHWYEEEVRGVIIGDIAQPYEFWSTGAKPERISRGFFESDAEAEAWFKLAFPEFYAQGIEMRVFDQPETANSVERSMR